MIVMLNGVRHRVEKVNECRAYCVPLRKKRVIFKDRVMNKTIQFMRKGKAISISPDSEIPILSYGKKTTGAPSTRAGQHETLNTNI
jgi:hypothetical protein